MIIASIKALIYHVSSLAQTHLSQREMFYNMYSYDHFQPAFISLQRDN